MVIARILPEEGEGISYAVSSDKARRVASSLIEYGSFTPPYLRIGMSDLTPEKARARNLTTVSGVLVTEVYKGSPADKAGVKVDDTIVAVDATAVRQEAHLVNYVAQHKSPEETVKLTVIRGGDRMEMEVELGDPPF
jgi:S1-C subfamily serine protease